MPKFYIIAGPPGIGKSVNSQLFLPPNIEIINHDNLFRQFKSKKSYFY
jgi:predicted ABC-type ATPase